MFNRFNSKLMPKLRNFRRRLTSSIPEDGNISRRHFTLHPSPDLSNNFSDSQSTNQTVCEVEDRDKVFTTKKLTLTDRMKIALHHLKKGMSDVASDSHYLASTVYSNGFVEKRYTAIQLKERRRIFKDLFKFIPFSIIISIPLLEAFIPIYIIVFPNSIPSQFLLENQIGKKNSLLAEK